MLNKAIQVVYLVLIVCTLVLAKPPNILLVVADDYGWNDIGYHGSQIKTPTLDSLASEGVKLENYYVQPICSPSRSQLLSGRYQIHTGLQHGIIWPLQPNCLPTEMPTFADELKKLGYSTHAVGKWHVGMYKKECLPTSRGFDTYFGYLTGSEDYYQHTKCYGGFCGLDLRDNLAPVTNLNGSYSANIFAERVIEIVDQHSRNNPEQPLLVYLPFQSVHMPLQVPAKYLEQYSSIKNRNRRIYAGMVSAMDEAIFNITSAFKNNNMWDDTLMIFSTDNGGQVLAGGNNYPLKGWKGSLWEGGIRGVGFVHGKMLNTTGVVNDELIHISDWFPTILSVAGGDSKGLQLDGYNAWDAISNGGSSERMEILHNIDPLYKPRGKPVMANTFDTRIRAAIRFGDWKLLTGDPGVDQTAHVKPPPTDYLMLNNSCVDIYDEIDPYANCKLFTQFRSSIDKNQNVWLYNLKTDPNEYSDVSDKNPGVVKMLLDRLAYYNSTAVPCRYPVDDKGGNPQLHGGVWGPWQ